jgi:GAF domain-containing protein
VASICAKLLGARGSLLTIDLVNGVKTTLRASHGAVPDSCQQDQGCCEGCPILDPAGDPAAPVAQVPLAAGPSPEHALCSRLSFKGRYTGHLCVFDKVVREEGTGPGFSADDRNLLSTMASMISSALENALTFQKVEELAQRNEEMVGALATLFEISSVLMTTVDLNQTMLIVLHAATHPAGLDHDRALLFFAARSRP